MRKRKTYAILFIIVLIISGFIIQKCVKNYRAKWGDVEQSFMADFTQDGKQELLLMYDDYKKKSAMKLVDFENNRTIWKSTSKPSFIRDTKRVAVKDGILAIAYDDLRNMPDNGYSSLGVEAFAAKSGEKLWDYRFAEDRREFGLYFWMVEYKAKLFLLTTNRDQDRILTALNLKNGDLLWEKKLSGIAYDAPKFVGNNLVIKEHNNLSIIDIYTGKAFHDMRKQEIARVLTSDSSIYVFKRDTVLEFDSVLRPAIYNGKPIILVNRDSNYVDFNSITKGCFLSFIRNSYNVKTNNKQYAIKSTPYKSGFKEYIFHFEDSVQFQDFWLRDLISRGSDFSGLVNINTKYIPLILEKEIDRNSSWKQIVIFDVELGEISWKSKFSKFDAIDLISRDILYHKGNFVIILKNNASDDQKANHTFLSLNGKTGEFVSNVNFYSDEVCFSTTHWSGFSMFAGDYFYGTSNMLFYPPQYAWAMKFPELELLYATTEDIKTKDATKELEEMFGKMPWEKKTR